VGVTYALAGWIRHVDWDNNRGREFLDCLSNTRRSAAALHRDLEKLHRHLKELDQSDASEYLMASIISRMLRYLPTFSGGTHVVMPTHERQGRPRGRRRRGLKQYPGLAQLVSGLEFSAQEAGGGFGIPNKKLKKGRLIQALDWLRAFLASSSDWSWLAELLPAPGQHPFSVYEGALMAIYDLHMTRIATGTGDRTENVTDPAKARIDLEEVRRMRAFAKSMRYIEAG